MNRRKHVSGEAFKIPTTQPMATFHSVPFLLTVLAYPNQREKRDKFMEGLHALLGRQLDDRELPDWLQPVFPKMKSRKIDGVVGMGIKRVCHRVRMGSVGWSLFAGTGIRIRYDVPASNGAIGDELYGISTLTEAIRIMLDQKVRATGKFTGDGTRTAHDSAIANDMRIWSDSLPVLHLAMALFSRVNGFNDDFSFDQRMWALIHDTRWLDATLSEAEGIFPLLPLRIPRFVPNAAIRITAL